MLLLDYFDMYIMRASTNCLIHDVHMRMILQPHDEFKLYFCVIVASFAC